MGRMYEVTVSCIYICMLIPVAHNTDLPLGHKQTELYNRPAGLGSKEWEFLRGHLRKCWRAQQ